MRLFCYIHHMKITISYNIHLNIKIYHIFAVKIIKLIYKTYYILVNDKY